ncbi:hypothetical protein KHQ89_05300 [Mycoplasmatota bacterium]|nr:hypothetical protein KHQ89_05300 [Mycoplasmatota bacterium]
MKHIFIYISLVLLATTLVWIIKENETVMPLKIYTLDTYYSYANQDNKSIEIDFYINGTHPLTDVESYMETELVNEDKNKKLSLDLNEIKMISSENYLGETYQKYALIFDMPNINQSFYIEDAFINITLLNQDEYEFYIGSFSLYTLEESDQEIFLWESLSAIKDAHIDINRMSQIQVTYDEIYQSITSVELGFGFETSYELTDDALLINITDEQQLFYACPIIIHYMNGESEIIDYFMYINDFQMMKQSGLLLHGYLLS